MLNSIGILSCRPGWKKRLCISTKPPKTVIVGDMVKIEWLPLAAVTAVAVIGAAILMVPVVFADRVPIGVRLGDVPMTGLNKGDLPGAVAVYGQELVKSNVQLHLRGKTVPYTLEELGFALDEQETVQRIMHQTTFSFNLMAIQAVDPVLKLDVLLARQALHRDFDELISLPSNASLTAAGSTFQLVPSLPGEDIDLLTLEQDVIDHVANSRNSAIELQVISAPAAIGDNEVTGAKVLAEKLLTSGFMVRFEENEYAVKPFTVRRMLTFVEQNDPHTAGNTILGVAFEETELQSYVEATIAPPINQEPINARFELAAPAGGGVQTATASSNDLNGRRVTQFAVPQQGQSVDIVESVKNVGLALTAGQTQADLSVAVVEPDIKEAIDLDRLGIATLLARGESDFARSPANRIHNIRVGAGKYHGLLIAPGEEFSFNRFLGPVDAANGFKPELVIKNNVTTPEFGGGLCQVSTTVFRAAAHSGMKITKRKNHSYAVSYYGVPGFDATIYPPYTDFRFLNNTPGYILIQTSIAGTKLSFEFWGTDDGREVVVSGPSPYGRQPDGSVKSTLTQTVTKDGEVLVEDSFYSNYKSPKLFPKVLAANGEAPPAPEPSVQPPKPDAKNTAKPSSQPASTADKPTPTPSGAPAANSNKAKTL